MCDYPFFIPQVVLFANSSLFWFKVTNEHREFRNYLSPVYFLMGNYRLCGGSVLCCKLPENSDLILQIYSARRSIDLALFISFSRFMYICLYKADIIVYNYPVVLLRDAVIPA